MSLELNPQAVCILVVRQKGEEIEVLACSRKSDPHDFGLPGGKVEGREEPKYAALREFEEETQIRLCGRTHAKYENYLTPVYTGMCWEPDLKSGYLTTTYLYSGGIDLPTSIHMSVPLEINLDLLEGYRPKNEGSLAWKRPFNLAMNGSFKDYNRRLFEHMGFFPPGKPLRG